MCFGTSSKMYKRRTGSITLKHEAGQYPGTLIVPLGAFFQPEFFKMNEGFVAGWFSLLAHRCRGRRSAPNIIVILGDDIGLLRYRMLRREIATPNLDALAAGGMRFTQFYNTARCCPTRARCSPDCTRIKRAWLHDGSRALQREGDDQ